MALSCQRLRTPCRLRVRPGPRATIARMMVIRCTHTLLRVGKRRAAFPVQRPDDAPPRYRAPAQLASVKFAYFHRLRPAA
jgi:hypothetical protein